MYYKLNFIFFDKIDDYICSFMRKGLISFRKGFIFFVFIWKLYESKLFFIGEFSNFFVSLCIICFF